MATENAISPRALIREHDVQTLAPVRSFGGPDFDKTDFLEVKANDSAVASGQRKVVLNGQNDDSDVTRVHVAIEGKGNGLLILPKIAQADRPTAAAALNGGMYYDTTDHDVFVCANGSWVVVGAQS